MERRRFGTGAYQFALDMAVSAVPLSIAVAPISVLTGVVCGAIHAGWKGRGFIDGGLEFLNGVAAGALLGLLPPLYIALSPIASMLLIPAMPFYGVAWLAAKHCKPATRKKEEVVVKNDKHAMY